MEGEQVYMWIYSAEYSSVNSRSLVDCLYTKTQANAHGLREELSKFNCPQRFNNIINNAIEEGNAMYKNKLVDTATPYVNELAETIKRCAADGHNRCSIIICKTNGIKAEIIANFIMENININIEIEPICSRTIKLHAEW